jgi:hypothetical protein
MLKEIRERHERMTIALQKDTPEFPWRYMRVHQVNIVHQDRAELLKIIDDFQLIVKDMIDCSCDTNCKGHKEYSWGRVVFSK